MKNDDKYIEQLLGVALDDSVESSPPELKTEEELAAEGIEPHEFSKGFDPCIPPSYQANIGAYPIR